MDINNYMTRQEAAYRWGILEETLKQRTRSSARKQLQPHIDAGRVKEFRNPERKQSVWIFSKEVMEIWYGPEPNR